MTRKQRLARVERTIKEQRVMVSWPEVAAAMARIRARVRLKVARLFPRSDAVSDIIAEVSAQLAGDSPAQAAQDDATTTRWRQANGVSPDAGEVRQRILRRLEEMARRQHAGREENDTHGS